MRQALGVPKIETDRDTAVKTATFLFRTRLLSASSTRMWTRTRKISEHQVLAQFGASSIPHTNSALLSYLGTWNRQTQALEAYGTDANRDATTGLSLDLILDYRIDLTWGLACVPACWCNRHEMYLTAHGLDGRIAPLYEIPSSRKRTHTHILANICHSLFR